MTDEQQARIIHLYAISGTMTRVPDGWCDKCQLSSIWEGPIWLLGPHGVGPWGHVRGCEECSTWVRSRP